VGFTGQAVYFAVARDEPKLNIFVTLSGERLFLVDKGDDPKGLSPVAVYPVDGRVDLWRQLTGIHKLAPQTPEKKCYMVSALRQ
jgi:hypothetical protein